MTRHQSIPAVKPAAAPTHGQVGLWGLAAGIARRWKGEGW